MAAIDAARNAERGTAFTFSLSFSLFFINNGCPVVGHARRRPDTPARQTRFRVNTILLRLAVHAAAHFRDAAGAVAPPQQALRSALSASGGAAAAASRYAMRSQPLGNLTSSSVHRRARPDREHRSERFAQEYGCNHIQYYA